LHGTKLLESLNENGHLFWCHAFFQSLRLGCGSVLVGAADEKCVVACKHLPSSYVQAAQNRVNLT